MRRRRKYNQSETKGMIQVIAWVVEGSNYQNFIRETRAFWYRILSTKDCYLQEKAAANQQLG
jgi:hypothetical protein